MFNRATLVGHLGADPEMKQTRDGRPIANLRLATSETWRDKNSGERKEKTEWHRIVIFNEGLAKIAEQYLKKGSKVFIEGAIQTRKWTDQAGVEKYSTEIVLAAYGGTIKMLDGKGERGGGRADDDDSWGETAPSRPSRGTSSSGARGRSAHSDMDDEIPFAPEWRG